jgi:maleylacetoacetate isomerase
VLRLYDYYRSSAAYRVRIALRLKRLDYQSVPVNLRDGAQRDHAYRQRNPQGLVPALEDGKQVLTQSLAIIHYLDRLQPEPRLLPDEALRRARVEAFAYAIACDIHPLCNLRVLRYLREELAQDQAAVDAWYRHWVGEGLQGLEALAEAHGGPFCVGDTLTMADVLLVPQLFNARRFDCPLDDYPTLVAIDARLQQIEAFARAAPEQQPDAPSP